MNSDVKVPLLKMLVIIVDREQSKQINKVFRSQRIPMHFECMGEGTAGSEIMDLLGLGSIDKSVFLNIMPEQRATSVLSVVAEKMHMHKPGTGIAFILPLSGVSSRVIGMLDAEVKEKLEREFEKEVNRMKNSATHDLIMAVVNQGYTEDLMSAARAAGATGGTIIHARGVGQEEAVRFFGISVQPEKEIVLIVSTHEAKQSIMQAICKACGSKTEARGLVFSLPVDSVSNL